MAKESFSSSRREFLKGGLLTASAFLAEIALPPGARAQIEKLLATQETKDENLSGLLSRLRQDVWDKNTEVFWAHVKKGERAVSINILEHATSDTAKAIDLSPLFEDKNVSKIYLVHTHPASAYAEEPSLKPQEIERIIKSKQSKFPFIPSGIDIAGYIYGKLQTQKRPKKQEITHYIVEPTGVWSYDVNISHSTIKSFLPKAEKAETIEEMAQGINTLSFALAIVTNDWQEKIFKEGGLSEDNLKTLKDEAREKWGIIFSYQPFSAP